MLTLNIHKKIKTILILVSLVLFFASYITYTNIDQNSGFSEEFIIFRLLRSISSFVFLILIIIFQKKEINRILLIFISIYTLSSFLTLWYENEILATVSMGLNSFSFFLLIIYLYPKVKNIKIDLFVISSFIFIFIFLSYLGYLFAISFKEYTLSKLHYFFIVSSVIFYVINIFLGIMYNHKYSTKKSLIFMGFLIALLFAEIFRAIAYYHIVYDYVSVHIARALLIIAMAIFSFYTLLNSKEEDDDYKKYI